MLTPRLPLDVIRQRALESDIRRNLVRNINAPVPYDFLRTEAQMSRLGILDRAGRLVDPRVSAIRNPIRSNQGINTSATVNLGNLPESQLVLPTGIGITGNRPLVDEDYLTPLNTYTDPSIIPEQQGNDNWKWNTIFPANRKELKRNIRANNALGVPGEFVLLPGGVNQAKAQALVDEFIPIGQRYGYDISLGKAQKAGDQWQQSLKMKRIDQAKLADQIAQRNKRVSLFDFNPGNAAEIGSPAFQVGFAQNLATPPALLADLPPSIRKGYSGYTGYAPNFMIENRSPIVGDLQPLEGLMYDIYKSNLIHRANSGAVGLTDDIFPVYPGSRDANQATDKQMDMRPLMVVNRDPKQPVVPGVKPIGVVMARTPDGKIINYPVSDLPPEIQERLNAGYQIGNATTWSTSNRPEDAVYYDWKQYMGASTGDAMTIYDLERAGKLAEAEALRDTQPDYFFPGQTYSRAVNPEIAAQTRQNYATQAQIEQVNNQINQLRSQGLVGSYPSNPTEIDQQLNQLNEQYGNLVFSELQNETNRAIDWKQNRWKELQQINNRIQELQQVKQSQAEAGITNYRLDNEIDNLSNQYLTIQETLKQNPINNTVPVDNSQKLQGIEQQLERLNQQQQLNQLNQQVVDLQGNIIPVPNLTTIAGPAIPNPKKRIANPFNETTRSLPEEAFRPLVDAEMQYSAPLVLEGGKITDPSNLINRRRAVYQLPDGRVITTGSLADKTARMLQRRGADARLYGANQEGYVVGVNQATGRVKDIIEVAPRDVVRQLEDLGLAERVEGFDITPQLFAEQQANPKARQTLAEYMQVQDRGVPAAYRMPGSTSFRPSWAGPDATAFAGGPATGYDDLKLMFQDRSPAEIEEFTQAQWQAEQLNQARNKVGYRGYSPGQITPGMVDASNLLEISDELREQEALEAMRQAIANNSMVKNKPGTFYSNVLGEVSQTNIDERRPSYNEQKREAYKAYETNYATENSAARERMTELAQNEIGIIPEARISGNVDLYGSTGTILLPSTAFEDDKLTGFPLSLPELVDVYDQSGNLITIRRDPNAVTRKYNSDYQKQYREYEAGKQSYPAQQYYSQYGDFDGQNNFYKTRDAFDQLKDLEKRSKELMIAYKQTKNPKLLQAAVVLENRTKLAKQEIAKAYRKIDEKAGLDPNQPPMLQVNIADTSTIDLQGYMDYLQGSTKLGWQREYTEIPPGTRVQQRYELGNPLTTPLKKETIAAEDGGYILDPTAKLRKVERPIVIQPRNTQYPSVPIAVEREQDKQNRYQQYRGF